MVATIPAILFLLLGIIILGFAFKVLATALFGPISFTAAKDGLTFGRRRRALAKAAALVEAGTTPPLSVIGALRSSFVVESGALAEEAIAKTHQHHQEFMGVLIDYAGQRNVRISNLAVIEELFSNRTKLLSELQEVREARREVKKKQKGKGRETPEWADSAFDKKIALLDERLAVNAKSLERELDDAFREFLDPPVSASTFH